MTSSSMAQVESPLVERLCELVCLIYLQTKILELKDCYYMPKIIRNIIFISLLLKQGYDIRLMEMDAPFSFLMNFMTVVILITIF